jgi:putative oxidoreductase
MNNAAKQFPVERMPWLLSVVRIAVGLLFFQHGAEKIWGFAGGRPDHNFGTLHGIAGPIEVIGGGLLIAGLFTRTTAFILCGEMAVAYFSRWAPRGFWPITNGGEEAVIFCFLFLWLVSAGAGPWSLDYLIQRRFESAGAARRTGPPTGTLAAGNPG